MSASDFQVIGASSGGSSLKDILSDEDEGHSPYIIVLSPQGALNPTPARIGPRNPERQQSEEGTSRGLLPAGGASGSSGGGGDGDAERADMILDSTYERPVSNGPNTIEPQSRPTDAGPPASRDEGSSIGAAGESPPSREHPDGHSPACESESGDRDAAEDGEAGSEEGDAGSLLSLLSALDEHTFASIPPALLQRLQQLEEERDILAERLLESDAELCALRASYSQLSQSHASSQTWLNQVLEQQMELAERRQRRQRQALLTSSSSRAGASPAKRSRLRQALGDQAPEPLSADVTGEIDWVDEAEVEADKDQGGAAAPAGMSAGAGAAGNVAAARSGGSLASRGAPRDAADDRRSHSAGPVAGAEGPAAAPVRQQAAAGDGATGAERARGADDPEEGTAGGEAAAAQQCSSGKMEQRRLSGSTQVALQDEATAHAEAASSAEAPPDTVPGAVRALTNAAGKAAEVQAPEGEPSSDHAAVSDGAGGGSGAVSGSRPCAEAESCGTRGSSNSGCSSSSSQPPASQSQPRQRSHATESAVGKAKAGTSAKPPVPVQGRGGSPGLPLGAPGAVALLIVALLVSVLFMWARPLGPPAPAAPTDPSAAPPHAHADLFPPSVHHGVHGSPVYVDGRASSGGDVGDGVAAAAAGPAEGAAEAGHPLVASTTGAGSSLGGREGQGGGSAGAGAAGPGAGAGPATAAPVGSPVGGPPATPHGHGACAALRDLALALSCAGPAAPPQSASGWQGSLSAWGGSSGGAGGCGGVAQCRVAAAAAVEGAPAADLQPRAYAVRGAMADLAARWRRLAAPLQALAARGGGAAGIGGAADVSDVVASKALGVWARRQWLPAMQRLVLGVADDDELPEAMLAAHRAVVLTSRHYSQTVHDHKPENLTGPLLARVETSLAGMAAVATVHVDAARDGGAAAVEVHMADAANCLSWQAAHIEAAAEVADCKRRCRPRARLAAALASLGVPRHLAEHALGLGHADQHPGAATHPADAHGFDAGAWLRETPHLRGWLEAALLAATDGAPGKAWRPLLRAAGDAAAKAAAAAGRAARAAAEAAEAALGEVEATAATTAKAAAGAGAAAAKAAAGVAAGGGWRQVREDLTAELRRLSGQVRAQWREAASGSRQRAAPGVPAILEEAVQGLLAAARQAYRAQYDALRCACEAVDTAAAGAAPARLHVNGTVGPECVNGLEALVLEAQREAAATAAAAAAAGREEALPAGSGGGGEGKGEHAVLPMLSQKLSAALMRLRADVVGLSGAVGRVRALCVAAVEGAVAYREAQAGAS